MGNQYGVAGKSTREGTRKKRNNAIYYSLFAIAVIVIAYLLITNNKVLGLGGGVVLALLFVMRLAPDILEKFLGTNKKQERHYSQGAKGEEQVGELLAQLGTDYVIMHDWTSPYGNIDHIVYDKTGNIFILETKSHFGKVTANGDQLLRNGHTFEKDIIKQALSNSYWVKEKVEARLGCNAWVTPVLVFTNAFVTFGKPIKGVYYINKKYLLQFLQTHKGSSPAGVKLWEIREKIK